jgi:hypothetical protein
LEVGTSLELDENQKLPEDPLSNLISDFTKLKLDESQKMNNVLKSLSRNSHGFLQRTVTRKSEYSPKNLEKIIADLYKICMESPVDKKTYKNPADLESPYNDTNNDKFDKDPNCILMSQEKHEGSFKSLNLSLRKDTLSCFTTPYMLKDNISAKFNAHPRKTLFHKSPLLNDNQDNMSVQLVQGNNNHDKSSVVEDKVMKNSSSKKQGQLGESRRDVPVNPIDLSCVSAQKRDRNSKIIKNAMNLGSKEKSKLQRITKRINKMRITPKGQRTFKELFEFGVYKSFPKKTDLITDLVKILKDNIDFFQTNFNLYQRGEFF